MAVHRLQTHVSSATFLWLRSIFCGALCAFTVACMLAQSPQQSSTDESWTATTDSSLVNGNPTRTVESHTKSGNRIIDTQKLETRGVNGHYEPFSESETETVQVDATTTKTVVRNYTWDGNGRRTLAQVIEEQSHTAASGDTRTERKTSNSDVNGNFQVVQARNRRRAKHRSRNRGDENYSVPGKQLRRIYPITTGPGIENT